MSIVLVFIFVNLNFAYFILDESYSPETNLQPLSPRLRSEEEKVSPRSNRPRTLSGMFHIFGLFCRRYSFRFISFVFSSGLEYAKLLY